MERYSDRVPGVDAVVGGYRVLLRLPVPLDEIFLSRNWTSRSPSVIAAAKPDAVLLCGPLEGERARGTGIRNLMRTLDGSDTARP